MPLTGYWTRVTAFPVAVPPFVNPAILCDGNARFDARDRNPFRVMALPTGGAAGGSKSLRDPDAKIE
jgi:hypothetical protein